MFARLSQAISTIALWVLASGYSLEKPPFSCGMSPGYGADQVYVLGLKMHLVAMAALLAALKLGHKPPPLYIAHFAGAALIGLSMFPAPFPSTLHLASTIASTLITLGVMFAAFLTEEPVESAVEVALDGI